MKLLNFFFLKSSCTWRVIGKIELLGDDYVIKRNLLSLSSGTYSFATGEVKVTNIEAKRLGVIPLDLNKYSTKCKEILSCPDSPIF